MDNKEIFIEIVKKITNYEIEYNDFEAILLKNKSLLFSNLFECFLYKISISKYAIRFNDNMSPDEFNKAYSILVEKFGEPNYVAEFYGYVWKYKGYCISFGFISLNYNYDVPMICIFKRIGLLTKKVKYSRYSLIKNSIRKLIEEKFKINVDAGEYMLVHVTATFGFSTLLRVNNHDLFIMYKRKRIMISYIPIVREDNLEIVKSNNSIRKEIKNVSDINFKNKLEDLISKL